MHKICEKTSLPHRNLVNSNPKHEIFFILVREFLPSSQGSQSPWPLSQKAIEAGLTSLDKPKIASTPFFSSFASLSRPFTPAARSAFALRSTAISCTVIYTTTRTYAKGKKGKMAPKKKVEEEKILLGRPGNNLKSGIVRPATASPTT